MAWKVDSWRPDGYFARELVPFNTLQGKTFTRVKKVEANRAGEGEGILFEEADGTRYKQYHNQDCCENVYIESIVGDLSDLENTPILLAEEVNSEGKEGPDQDAYQEEETWTFYKLRTIKGSVDIRWYGTSNGCYSENAELFLVFAPRTN